jgi:hypothetical protein
MGKNMKRCFCLSVNLVFFVVIIGHLLLPENALAQDEANLFHWAYAPAFGTGAYRVGDEETFVLTFKPKIDLRKQRNHRIGVKLTLPLSLGLQTLNLNELISDDLPDQLTTVSFVPGVEFIVPVGQSWTVKPFGNVGYGTSYTLEQAAWIYFLGAKSRYVFNWGKAQMGFLNELLWAGYLPDPGEYDTFSRFMLGLEAQYPLGNAQFLNQQLFLEPHILYYRYLDDLDFFEPLGDGRILSLEEEVELAVALGTKTPQKFWIFRPDRIGIGLRVSEELKGVRIFIRSVFD